MSRKSKSSDHVIKALNPKDADTKYTGDEPFFAVQPDSEFRNSALARAFSWYTRFYVRKDAKDLLIQYLEQNDRKQDAKIMAKAPESEILTTYGWLARMTLRGLQLTEHEELSLQNEISRLITCVHKPETVFKSNLTPQEVETEKEKEPVNRPNVQEIMREKAREATGEIIGLFDEFIQAGMKGNLPGKSITFCHNISLSYLTFGRKNSMNGMKCKKAKTHNLLRVIVSSARCKLKI